MYVADGDFNSEFQQLMHHFRTVFWRNYTRHWDLMPESPARDKMSGALEDTPFNKLFAKQFELMELEIKSLFCQSGKCVVDHYSGMSPPRRDESFKCAPGSAPNKPINFYDVWRRYNEFVRLIKSDACRETIQLLRPDYAAGNYTPGRAMIKFKPGGPLVPLTVCVLYEDTKCFPSNITEAQVFDEYLFKKFGVTAAIERSRRYDPKSLSRTDAGRKENYYYDYPMKNLFCFSGRCDRETDRCLPGPRSPQLLKVYLDDTERVNAFSVFKLVAISIIILFRCRLNHVFLISLLGLTSSAYAEPCEDLGRSPTEFEEVSMTFITKSANKSVKICLVKANELCLSQDINHYPSQYYVTYLKKLLGGAYSKIENITRVPPRPGNSIANNFTRDNDIFDDDFAQRMNDITYQIRNLFCRYIALKVHDFKYQNDNIFITHLNSDLQGWCMQARKRYRGLWLCRRNTAANQNRLP